MKVVYYIPMRKEILTKFMNNQITVFYYFKKISGLILIILGIPGLFLPIIPGLILIVAGIILIGNKRLLEKLKKLKNYLKEKFF